MTTDDKCRPLFKFYGSRVTYDAYIARFGNWPADPEFVEVVKLPEGVVVPKPRVKEEERQDAP